MPFSFEPLELPEVIQVDPEVFRDDRGYLLESYDKHQFGEAGIDVTFDLDFYSRSDPSVVRGLHFQRPPYEQAKLVYCSEGTIFDVAVDVRQNSDTFGEYVSLTLDDAACRMVYVPVGFAHGFAVLEGPATVHYKASSPYAPEHEGGIRWDDSDVDIDWPIDDPTVSDRDASLPRLRELKDGP